MWQIISDLNPLYDELKPKRISYTYLHGKLEKDCGYDCFGFVDCELPLQYNCDTYIDTAEMVGGIYPCEYNGKGCLLYLWFTPNKNRYSGSESHGLAVYDDDIEAIQWAEKCFVDKRWNL